MMPEFDWFDDATVIVAPQSPIAIYRNGWDQITIRRRAEMWEGDEDHIVSITREMIPKIAQALFEAAGLGPIEFVRPLGDGSYADIDVDDIRDEQPHRNSKAPSKAAARQRRYRNKKRNGGGDSVTLAVTPERDGDGDADRDGTPTLFQAAD